MRRSPRNTPPCARAREARMPKPRPKPWRSVSMIEAREWLVGRTVAAMRFDDQGEFGWQEIDFTDGRSLRYEWDSGGALSDVTWESARFDCYVLDGAADA